MVPALAPPHAPPQAVATAPYAADADRWRAVRANDRAADGHFIYAVTSTGIYCRPHCPSRQPKRANVRFFRLPESARAAGFRPCKRCRPDEMPGNLPEVAQVRQICAWIAEADMAADKGVPLIKVAVAASEKPGTTTLPMDSIVAQLKAAA